MGIVLTEFYMNLIYPFFANHQYKLKAGIYANGEYEHFEEGIVQFYKEEFGLENHERILKHLKLALGILKAQPNSKCPICGDIKYKKCCKKITDQLMIYERQRLFKDVEIFSK